MTFQYNLFLLLRNYAKMCLRLRGQLLYCSEFVSSIKLLVWCATPFLSGKLSVILRLVFDKIVKRLLQFGNILMLVKFQNDQFRQAQKLLRAATVCQLFIIGSSEYFPVTTINQYSRRIQIEGLVSEIPLTRMGAHVVQYCGNFVDACS